MHGWFKSVVPEPEPKPPVRIISDLLCNGFLVNMQSNPICLLSSSERARKSVMRVQAGRCESAPEEKLMSELRCMDVLVFGHVNLIFTLRRACLFCVLL